MVDDSGRVLSKMESPTDLISATQTDRADSRHVAKTARHARVEISGIGIGSTGMVYPFSGAFGDVDFLPGWQGNNPVEDLARAFNLTVALENDADASALGEAGWGAGKGKSRLVYVTVGTGIGGGIIVDGQLYRGADMAHPEIGHHVIDPSGPLAPAVSEGVGNRWRPVRPWLRGSRGTHRQAAAILQISAQNKSASLRNREISWPAGRLSEKLTTWVSVWPIWSIFCAGLIVLGGSVMKGAAFFLMASAK